ncbi:MAG: FemAB family PEP-CTERM system-associated protein [Anaerolineae bacterium]|nr:FemAB family PEP-CTERM system-associated protein [Gemmatimonadaceae bacterium]
MRIQAFTGPPEEWDAFVRAQPQWTHFHLHDWRRVMERTFGHECIYLTTRNDREEISGVLPLVRVKSVLFGHFLVSMPFLNYGGPLGDAEAVRALVAHAVDFARRDRVKLLELRSETALPIELPVSHRKITVILDLPPNSDALSRQLDAKVRSQVKRPRKEGVTVKFGADQVAPFFQVFAQHMRDLGTPTQPLRFFESIRENFPTDALFGCAYLGDKPIACGAGFRWRDEFEMTWASSLREYSRIAPNMLLYWSFMERSIAEGVRTFNFGRCTPDSGTHKFKRQWGGRDQPLWWYASSASSDVKTPSPNDGAYAWGPRLWRKLPAAVATALGPRIVRYIP